MFLNEKWCKEFFDTVQSKMGYIYVAHPKYIQDEEVFKIGLSKSNPFVRMKTLNSSGVMKGFHLDRVYFSIDRFNMEKTIHTHFKDCRLEKEFFKGNLQFFNHFISGVEEAERNFFNFCDYFSLINGTFETWLDSFDLPLLIDMSAN